MVCNADLAGKLSLYWDSLYQLYSLSVHSNKTLLSVENQWRARFSWSELWLYFQFQTKFASCNSGLCREVLQWMCCQCEYNDLGVWMCKECQMMTSVACQLLHLTTAHEYLQANSNVGMEFSVLIPEFTIHQWGTTWDWHRNIPALANVSVYHKPEFLGRHSDSWYFIPGYVVHIRVGFPMLHLCSLLWPVSVAHLTEVHDRCTVPPLDNST